MRQAALRRRPLERQAVAPQVAVASSIPAPTEGWDASSPLAKMDPKRAIVLDNFFPQPEYLEFERGWVNHSTLLIDSASAGPVETLMAYQSVTNLDDKLFAVAGGSIFDATLAVDPGVETVTGLANSRLQFVNYATSANQYLVWVNGADPPQAWDGAAWVTPAITGITASDAINICVHKNRLWVILKDSLTAAFLPVDAYQGAMVEFPMIGIFSQGGYLVAMGTWTLDAGEGMDDHAVFITSEGQVAVFKGIDPTSTDFALVGVYHVGPPIGYRCLTRVGGDIAVVSIDGVLPLSAALIYDRAAMQNISLTRRIARAMNDAARAYKQNFGWQLIGYSRGTRAILNVPVQEGASQQQYQMNTLHGAWCRRLGRPANCWEVFQDRLFFGGNDGNVCEADTGGTDGGTAIVAQAKTAFNYFGAPGVLKKFGMLQTNMTTNGQVVPSMLVNVDYLDKTPDILSSVPTVEGALWDAVSWDLFSWPQEEFLLNEWQEANAIGYCASVNLIVAGQAGGGTGGFWDVDVWETGQWDALAGGSSAFAMRVNAYNLTFEMGGLL